MVPKVCKLPLNFPVLLQEALVKSVHVVACVLFRCICFTVYSCTILSIEQQRLILNSSCSPNHDYIWLYHIVLSASTSAGVDLAEPKSLRLGKACPVTLRPSLHKKRARLSNYLKVDLISSGASLNQVDPSFIGDPIVSIVYAFPTLIKTDHAGQTHLCTRRGRSLIPWLACVQVIPMCKSI